MNDKRRNFLPLYREGWIRIWNQNSGLRLWDHKADNKENEPELLKPDENFNLPDDLTA